MKRWNLFGKLRSFIRAVQWGLLRKDLEKVSFLNPESIVFGTRDISIRRRPFSDWYVVFIRIPGCKRYCTAVYRASSFRLAIRYIHESLNDPTSLIYQRIKSGEYARFALRFVSVNLDGVEL